MLLCLAARLLSFTRKTSKCWEWLGQIDKDGYGRIKVDGKTKRAHRVSYELFIGLIPKGHTVRHSCDNRKCVRPEHLLSGTKVNNTCDMYDRGRQASKLTEADVINIRTSSDTGRQLAHKYGVSDSTISKARLRRSWARAS